MQTTRMDVTSKDGAIVPVFAYNLGAENLKGVFVVCHGFGEHAGFYNKMSDYLAENNYACVVFDQRNHGEQATRAAVKRDKQLGVVPSYERFLDDLEAVLGTVRQTAPGTPIILYGHSMGGNIVINYLLRRGQSDILCAILEAPWLRLSNRFLRLIMTLTTTIWRVFIKAATYRKSRADNKSCSDTDGDKGDGATDGERRGRTPLYRTRLSLRILSGIKAGCAFALENAAQLSIPMYVGIAKRDRVISNQAIREFIESSGSDVVSEEYDSQHAIHSEERRYELFRDTVAFADSKLVFDNSRVSS